MKEIGGYFGLELEKGTSSFHKSGYLLKSGRSSLGLILLVTKPLNVYLPFYTCDALLEPLIANNIAFTFYGIDDNLEIVSLPVLQKDEMLIYINYYDIKRAYVEKLSATYTDRLVVDCTQSYFLKGNGVSWYFNSTRKFYGVPDGSDLYPPYNFESSALYSELEPNTNFTVQHLVSRFNGSTQEGYPHFKINEIANGGQVEAMSMLSQHLLSHIDHEHAMAVRKENFAYLHKHLEESNSIFIEDPGCSVPSFYPYLPVSKLEKKKFWEQNLFVPIFWADCLSRPGHEGFIKEKQLTEKLMPIPMDHRYNSGDLDVIIDFIKEQQHGF